MAAPIKKERVTTISTEKELARVLLEKSKAGGAWVASVLPFSTITDLVCYRVPSDVPDDYLDLGHNRQRGIAWKGSFKQFSKAAIIRDQNRAMGRQ